MTNEEVLVTPINSVEINGSGQVEAINNIISAGLLGTANTQNETNKPSEIQNEKTNQTTPRKKDSKRSHKKKLSVAERLARCAITENKEILDVPPDKAHSKVRRRPRRVLTYGSYEEYLAAKMKNHDPQNLDESDIVSYSEFNMSDDDTEAFEETQTNEKEILDGLIFEEKETKRREIQEDLFEQTSHPHINCDIAPSRNCCYDDIAVSIDRGMPGNQLEKEIEEQEERERREHENDLQNYSLTLYPESSLATHLNLNFNSDFIRNDFGANTGFDESAFSVSEINNDLISMSPRSPKSPRSQKKKSLCTFTLLSVNPDEEKVEAYQNKKNESKFYTHTRHYHTTDKTNELNASLGPMSGSISNVKLESRSEAFDNEEQLKNSENNQLQSAIEEENTNHVIEGRGLSCSGSNLSSEYCDLTIYSDEEKLKLSEDEHLKDDINEEYQTILEQKAFREQQKLLRQQEEEQRRQEQLKRIEQPDFPPNDIILNNDGTTDVGIQSVRCNIDDLINRRPSRRNRRRRQEELPSADKDLFAIQPRILLNIEQNRNACYDNINDAIDRGMPGNPLEDEIEELEALEAKERQDDIDYYNNTALYNERALKESLQQSMNSDVLRDEFGNRPEAEIIIEEEEEADYDSQSEPEQNIEPPPIDTLTDSPRLRRRVKKPVLKTFEVQCEIIHATPLEKLPLLPPPKETHDEVPKEEATLEERKEEAAPEEQKEEDTNEENVQTTTRSFTTADENQPKLILGSLGEQMNDALASAAEENKEDDDAGILERTANQFGGLFGSQSQVPKLGDPIGEAFQDLPKPIDVEEQKEITQPLVDPIGNALKDISLDATEKAAPEISEDQKLNTGDIESTAEQVTSAISHEANPLQDLQLNLLKLSNNVNNDTSEVSDNLPRIQMPAETDSTGLSPRATRSGSLRNTRRSPRYSYRSFDTSSPSINRLKERAMKLEPIANATNEQLELLIDDIEKERKLMMRERRFKDGLKCNAAIKHVEAILNKQQIEQNASNPNEELEIAFDNESRKKEQELIEKQRIARRKLRAKHKKELDELDKQWNSIQVRKKYNKPSEKLIEMKKQYDEMIAAENPAEEEAANKLNDEINHLRQLETEEAHQRMQRDYDSALLHLQKKQQQDMDLLQESGNVKMEQLKQQRARERRALDFNKDNTIRNNDNDNLLSAQSEELLSDQMGKLFDHSDTNKHVEKVDGEKLNLPPLDTRRPKSLRFAKPDSS